MIMQLQPTTKLSARAIEIKLANKPAEFLLKNENKHHSF
jgi:hypothetical protein